MQNAWNWVGRSEVISIKLMTENYRGGLGVPKPRAFGEISTPVKSNLLEQRVPSKNPIQTPRKALGDLTNTVIHSKSSKKPVKPSPVDTVSRLDESIFDLNVLDNIVEEDEVELFHGRKCGEESDDEVGEIPNALLRGRYMRMSWVLEEDVVEVCDVDVEEVGVLE